VVLRLLYAAQVDELHSEKILRARGERTAKVLIYGFLAAVFSKNLQLGGGSCPFASCFVARRRLMSFTHPNSDKDNTMPCAARCHVAVNHWTILQAALY
jgi:hypothetical protein